MWLNGLILLTILAAAKSSEAELIVEAAFQGRCGHNSPCEQLCYEIHDGMYECDCTEGYELNKNGYSCQEINSTFQPSGDGNSKGEEDILYQKGVSFSAKLANDDTSVNRIDSNGDDIDDNIENDYDRNNPSNTMEDNISFSDSSIEMLAFKNVPESQNIMISAAADAAIAATIENVTNQNEMIMMMINNNKNKNENENERNDDDDDYMIISDTNTNTNSNTNNNNIIYMGITRNPITATTTSSLSPVATTTTTSISSEIFNEIEEDNYYPKQDMSVYDDVNNNKLNLRQYNPNTYQNVIVEQLQQKQQQQQQQNSDQITANNEKLSTTTTIATIVHTKTNNNNNNYNYNNNNNPIATPATPTKSLTNSINPSLNSVQTAEDIRSSEVNEKIVNLPLMSIKDNSINSTDSIKSTALRPCLLDCGPEGICDYIDGDKKMRCLCPFDKTGKGCMEDFKINIPRFTKKSWLAFPALRGAYKHVQLRVEFRPESFDGIILLTGERDDLTGDFMALLIHQGFIEFWFDCGSGTGNVRSKETVLLNQWNTVTIYRHRWDAWLVLNHGTRVQGRSKGLFSRITFREPVFLGGTGNITGLAKRLPIFEGMIGCIRRFSANEHEYKFIAHPFGDVTKGFGIQDCTTDKCVKYPCQHGGKCLPSDQGAVCLCPLGFGGDLCEMRLDLQVPSFNGSSYLRYAPLGDSALIWLELQAIIKPHQQDGLLLYSGHERYGDYIALSLDDGFVEFAFDLGSGPAMVRSEFPISMGQWHTIKVSRTARLAVLKIDQGPEVMTISSNGFWHLSLPHSLFLGGIHNVKSLPLGLKEKGSFVGCIQKVEINGRTLSIISEALGGTNVDNCPHACVAKPCGQLAQCVPLMDNYECRCNPFNAQCNKAEEVPLKQIIMNDNSYKGNTSLSDNNVSHSKQHNSKIHRHNNNRSQSYRRATMVATTATTTTATITTNSRNIDNNKFEKSTILNGHNTRTNDMRRWHKKDSSLNSYSNENNYYYYGDELYDENEYDGMHLNENPVSEGRIQEKSDLRDNVVQEENLSSSAYMVDGYVPLNTGNFLKNKHRRDEVERIANLDKGEDDDGVIVMTEKVNEKKKKSKRKHSHHKKNHHQKRPATDDGKKSTTTKATATTTVFVGADVKGRINELDDDDDDDGDSGERATGMVVKRTGKSYHHGKRKNNDKPTTDMVGMKENHNHQHQHQREEASLFPVDDDYQTKELIQDMERIMKNSNELRSKESYGPAAFKRSLGACFTGTDSYFHYNDAETMSQIISYKIDLNLRFKTHSNYGVILWTGRQSALGSDDFLSLGIEQGYLHLRYNLGSGETNILFNATKVSDGLWHRVRAMRNLQEGSLEVDGRKSVIQRSPGKLRQLNTDTGLYVGGMPNAPYYTRRRYYTGIVGCISEIVLAGELRLNLDPATLGTAHNVEVGIL